MFVPPTCIQSQCQANRFSSVLSLINDQLMTLNRQGNMSLNKNNILNKKRNFTLFMYKNLHNITDMKALKIYLTSALNAEMALNCIFLSRAYTCRYCEYLNAVSGTPLSQYTENQSIIFPILSDSDNNSTITS